MLNQIKQHTGLKINEIAQKLGVSKPTIHNWEKKNSWPLWALEACGMEVIPKEDAQDVCEWIVGKNLNTGCQVVYIIFHLLELCLKPAYTAENQLNTRGKDEPINPNKPLRHSGAM